MQHSLGASSALLPSLEDGHSFRVEGASSSFPCGVSPLFLCLWHRLLSYRLLTNSCWVLLSSSSLDVPGSPVCLSVSLFLFRDTETVDQLKQELRQQIAADTMAAAVAQVRVEIMSAINNTTDQLSSTAAATQNIETNAPSAATSHRMSNRIPRTSKAASRKLVIPRKITQVQVTIQDSQR